MAGELGRVPSSVDMKRHGDYCIDTLRERFGTYTDVLQTIGAEPRRSYVTEEPTSYGPNWTEQRRLALERDQYTCQTPGCTITREEHQATSGVDLHVHHIKPFSYFVEQYGEDAYSHANQMENLITVCSKHHPMWNMFSPVVLCLLGFW